MDEHQQQHGGAIILRWRAPTGAQSSSSQAEKTAMQAAIVSLEDYEDWHKALLICDCKSLVDVGGNLLAPNEGIKLVQAAAARGNGERGLKVLWVPGHCGLKGNELAEEGTKAGSAQHQQLVALDPTTHRALITRNCASTFKTTPLHATTYTRSRLQ